MTKKRPGYHDLFAQVPLAAWEALAADALARGVSAARLLTDVLCKRYKVPAGRLPPPRRAGRKPRSG